MVSSGTVALLMRRQKKAPATTFQVWDTPYGRGREVHLWQIAPGVVTRLFRSGMTKAGSKPAFVVFGHHETTPRPHG
jgi:hypothetical protein